MSIGVVIPALRPGRALPELVQVLSTSDLARIVIVDDGSGAQSRSIFDECERNKKVTVVRHLVNLGKGAALKSGINNLLCQDPGLTGIVTADADGQHHPEDILKVAARLESEPGALVLGSRDFGQDVPLRSKLGNVVTRVLVRMLIGEPLEDTQTGLRGIPSSLAPQLLAIPSCGYEFELDMLIAARHCGVPIVQERIRTIYEEGNRSSHFDPLFDSMRIYFVLFRFSILSLLTAALDNLVFFLLFSAGASIAQAQAGARVAAVLFNYTAARRAVFLSKEAHGIVLPKYLALVAFSGLISYALIGFLHTTLGVPVMAAKLLAETALFAANFLVQRDFIFNRGRKREEATDWDTYYKSVPFTAKLTRRYTTRVLLDAMRRYGASEGASIVEIGGANSCFVDAIRRELRPAAYHVIDNNRYGLELLRQRTNGDVKLHERDVMALDLDLRADVVFSVGLIEHFDPAGTRKAIDAHFRLLKPNGYALISYPTPTWLYRAARALTESAGLWKFPDERPLEAGEVRQSAAGWGEVKFEKTLWPLVFTQRLMVVRKTAAARAAGSQS